MAQPFVPMLVIGFVETAEQADGVVERLRGAAFPSDAISVLLPTAEAAEPLHDDSGTKAPEGTVAGVGAGGLVGGALGWLTGIGALAIPGLGAFVAAGPLMAALSGAAVGASVGGVAGGLVGLGLSEPDTERYEGHLRAGRILVSVRATTPAGEAMARRILDGTAVDVSSAPESPG